MIYIITFVIQFTVHFTIYYLRMKILGLDLGISSIGWAVINIDNKSEDIDLLGFGSRIIPFNGDNDATDFAQGKGETPSSKRTQARSMRRNLDRWQLHREQLKEMLHSCRIMSASSKFEALDPFQVWKLRADAATPGKQLSFQDLSRVLLHINHRRGYKHAKSDDMSDSKTTAYVERINDLYAKIKAMDLTPGQYFCQELAKSAMESPKGKKHYTFRVKEKILPRKAYEEEVKQILEVQSQFYPEILTEKVKDELVRVIFYQRPLKSCKHLVSYCEFEKQLFPNSKGKLVDGGPKVAPRTSPLAQVCRIYEAINNISIVNPRLKGKTTGAEDMSLIPPSRHELKKFRYKYEFDAEEREKLFDYLNTHEKLTQAELFKILGLKRSDGFRCDQAVGKGIQGNMTRCQLEAALQGLEEDKIKKLLQFDLSFQQKVDKSTGEIREEISSSYNQQPLYALWHTLYSINDRDELFLVLKEKFGIDNQEVLDRLYTLDFVKAGYSNKSAKFMRRILPELMQGMQYNEACESIGIRHSDYLTKEENENRTLSNRLAQINPGELRQPIVERILNQTINLVNALMDKYGEIDEVRVELARELKQSKEERKRTTDNINLREKDNKALALQISELGIVPTRRRIQKMRMLAETGNRCMYCGKPVSPARFVEGHGYEVEHIIPRVRYFDDSFSNKVCACHECNAAKGAHTAFDFMSARGEQQFNEYKDRAAYLLDQKKISKQKYKYLMMSGSEIPQDFIERDLRESQYIAKKAKELLVTVIRNVYSSSGSVTDFFRNAWGYDTILHDLNFPRFDSAGLTEVQEYESHGHKHREPRIIGWNKRRDHRHHAIDALVIALTRQSYVQKLNTLNAAFDSRDERNEAKQNLSRWAASQPHIERSKVMAKADEIAISLKPGKRFATPGRAYKDPSGILRRTLVPRAPLHKDTVYGKIKVPDGLKKIKYALENLSLVADADLKEALAKRLSENIYDIKATLKSLKANPIKKEGTEVSAVPCFRDEIVVRYPIEAIKRKDLSSVVDKRIRKVLESRFAEVSSDKDFVKSLAERPLYSDADCTNRIKAVRCFTGIKADSLAIVRRNEAGDSIGYAMTRNNHHVAFYIGEDGKPLAITTSFWAAIKRKRYGMPVIITEPQKAWDILTVTEENPDIREIAAGLPPEQSRFLFSLRRNEMVVLGMSDDEWADAIRMNDKAAICRHLYRVWKLGNGDYYFKLHTNTTSIIEEGDKEMSEYYRCASIGSLLSLNPRKVTIDITGEIVPEK